MLTGWLRRGIGRFYERSRSFWVNRSVAKRAQQLADLLLQGRTIRGAEAAVNATVGAEMGVAAAPQWLAHRWLPGHPQ